MPANLVKSLADKSGLDIDTVEKYWQETKDIVKNQYPDIPEDDDRFWQLVVGIMKTRFKNKVKSESFEKLMIELLKEEGTVTGDIAKFDSPLTVQKREPDGFAPPYGHPYFDLQDDDEIKNILDGREKFQRWSNFVKDKGIHDWANKNIMKSFYLRIPATGVLIRAR